MIDKNTTDSYYIGLANDAVDQDEKLREYTLQGLKGKGVSELVDVIIERAQTTNSSTQLDQTIEESRQIALKLNTGNYENIQNLIASIRKKLSVIRTEQAENTPKEAIAFRAAHKKRFNRYN